jgi:hypothetical protein
MYILTFMCLDKLEDDQQDLDVGGRILKMDLREIGWGGMDWIRLT